MQNLLYSGGGVRISCTKLISSLFCYVLFKDKNMAEEDELIQHFNPSLEAGKVGQFELNLKKFCTYY